MLLVLLVLLAACAKCDCSACQELLLERGQARASAADAAASVCNGRSWQGACERVRCFVIGNEPIVAEDGWWALYCVWQVVLRAWRCVALGAGLC
jgi:hypothetical protein